MSERWETTQEYRDRTLVRLEDKVTSAEDLSEEHRKNAVHGATLGGIAAAATAAEHYVSQRWSYDQDVTGAFGAMCVAYTLIQLRYMYNQRRTAFECWQTAAHFFIEET
jgi:hypothetical protein